MFVERLYIISALFVLLLTGCSKGNSSDDLDRISSLVKAGERASALAALDSLDENSLDQSSRAYAYFLRGASLDEYDSMLPAVLWMKRSLREADQCGNDSIAHEAALYLAYLSNISGNITLAVQYGRQALALAERHDNPKWIGSDCLQLSGSYFAKGMQDSSNYFIERLVPLLNHQDKRDLPDMLNNIAVSRLNCNDKAGARKYLERSLSLSPNEHTYYLMAITFELEGRPDSAEMMWSKALNGSDLYLQARISEAYSKWLRSIGEHQRAGDMMVRAQELKDSLSRRGLLEGAITAHTYDERQTLEESHRYAKRIWIILLVALGGISVGLWYFSHSRAKRARLLSRSTNTMTGQMHEMETEMEALRTEIEMLQGQCERYNRDVHDLETLVRSKSKELRRLEEKYAVKETEMKRMKLHLHKIETEHDEVMSIGLERYNELMAGGKATKWSKKDMTLFVEYYQLTHPDFAISIRNDYMPLSPTLAMLLALTQMGYDNEQIQYILGMSAGAFRTARSRLNSARIE